MYYNSIKVCKDIVFRGFFTFVEMSKDSSAKY